MKQWQVTGRGVLALALALAAAAATAQADGPETVDMGSQVPDAAAIKEGLFPEDQCKALEKAGFKCMGFKPALRYSLPASTFKLGSAELPDLLRKQLDVFAEVLRMKKGSDQIVRVEGHADATGSDSANDALSLKRAEAVKSYLVSQGADAQMLEAVGVGAKAPKDPGKPFAAENRRVEIGRQKSP